MNPLLRSAFSFGSAVGITGALSPAVAALSFLDERAPDPLLHFWGNSILKSVGVKSVARGVENLPDTNFVLAVNHQSNFDALVLFAHIQRHMRFVAKAQLRKIPVFGWALHRAGNIFVDRTGSSADKNKLHDAVKAVQQRVSVVFFAEGTRSDDGVLRPFKKGAAIMALDAQVPLVPVAIAGTHLILQKGTMNIRPRPAALVIGQPISTAGLGAESRDSITEQAHAAVARQLEEGNRLVEELERTNY